MNKSLEATWRSLPADKRKAFAALLKKRGVEVSSMLPVASVDRDAPLPLSYAQERMWFLAQLEPGSAAYHIAGAFSVEGSLDARRVQGALDALVQRHESLRCAFVTEAGRPRVKLVADAHCELSQIDLSDCQSELEKQARLLLLAEEHAAQPFDLSVAPLLRVARVRLSETQHALLFCLHHIISDGWSLDTLQGEFAQLYAGGAAAALPELPVQYADYAAWQREQLSAGELDRQLRYWVEHLGRDESVLALPADLIRSGAPDQRGATYVFRIDAAQSARALQRAKSEGVTVFMLLLAAFETLLYRVTGQSDLRVGIPVANRPRQEFERIVGLFVNTHVWRTHVRGQDRFRDLLQQVKQVALGAHAHADLPFEQLVEAINPARSFGQNPLFQVMFNHEESAAERGAVPGPLRIEPLSAGGRSLQFDLDMETSWDDASGQIACAFNYATDLFLPETIASLAQRFQRMLAHAVAQPELRLADLPFLSDAERAQSLAATRPLRATSPAPGFVHQRIAEQARLRPLAVALQAEDGESWTYERLERESNRWASRLRALGVGPERRVGLCAGRSPRMMLGALAVWKAGGAYVPLDPSLPLARLRDIVADAEVDLLLGDASSPPAAELGAARCLRLDLDDLNADQQDAAPSPARVPALRGDNLAYVIYTSGSTGRPKAVGVTHAALAGHLHAAGQDYALCADDRALHFASMSFDAGVEQWANPLAHGARLIVRGDSLWSAEQALALVREQRITFLDLPPAYMREIARLALERGEPLPVRMCVVGGEALPRESLGAILRAVTPAPLVNAYGPTEAVVTPMTWHATDAAQCTTPYAPIGRVLGARRGYVLDADLNLVPAGVTGELYLGGDLLARGYLGQPGRSAERFIPDPYADQPGRRMYRTGDLARVRPDGHVEFLGRADDQIKLRGFRIELGEIEARLRALPGVHDAAVVSQPATQGARLVGYITGQADPDTAQQALRAVLPEYMIPSQLLALAELPRTASGKLDRKRLPAVDAPARAHVPPRNDRERVLCEIWQAVLDRESVSVTDNFFELGGDSIVSIQVVSRARQAGLAITPRDMFEHQTIEALARIATAARASTIDQGPATGQVPLTPVQLAFLALNSPEPDHYNQSVLLRCETRLDIERLRRALSQLIAHHDALRLRCSAQHQGYGQPQSDALWIRSARDRAEIEATCEAAQRSLCLARGELVRLLYIEVADGTSRVLLTAHHMAVDGVSWRVLLEDLERAYAGDPLPPKTSSFGAFAHALRQYATSTELASELTYWQTALSGPSAELARDHVPDGVGDAHDLEPVELRLDRSTTAQLLSLGHAAYRTQVQDLLLTALARATGGTLLLELESHGRADVLEAIDISRTVGWFTSEYPLRLDASGELPIAIKRVKQQLRDVPNLGIGYGALAHFGTDDQRAALAASPAPRVSFNYLGQFDATFTPGARFALADEASGAEWSPNTPLAHWLEISAQVYAGELAFSFAFDRRMFDRETMSALVGGYERELRALIAHCTASNTFGRTPSDFPLAKLTQSQVDTLVGSAPGIADIYPLTPMQKGILFHTLYAPDDNVYVTQLDVPITGLNPQRFTAAFARALDRHPILRTSFVWRGLAAPVQRVHDALPVPVELHDRATDLSELKAHEHARGFALEQAPLWRIALVQREAGCYHLIFTCHHLLLDGWSTARLLNEVLLDYVGQERPPAGPAFAEYLRFLSRRPSGASESFWRARLEPLEEPCLLQGTLSAAAGGDARQQVHTPLPAQHAARVFGFAQQERVTVNTLVQAAWLLLLQRYTGQQTVVFGATMSGRPAELPGSEEMLGLFINTLPIVATPRPEWSVRELVQRVQADNLSVREHEHTPLADVQRWAGFGGKTLFDSLLVFENYPVDKALGERWEGLEFGELSSLEGTNYALTVGVSVSDRLDIEYGFTSASFDTAQIERLGAQLLGVLATFAAEPDTQLGNLVLAGEPSRQLSSATLAPADTFLDQVIARHASGPAADRVAVISRSERLTFAELERASNQLARRLQQSGVQPGVCVGICLPREASFIVSALAVWKVGAAYLALDSKLAPERLQFMLADAGVKLVIANPTTRSALPAAHVLEMDLSTELNALNAPPAKPLVAMARSGDQLAYVIYTSGSTGTPKGVGVSHAAISLHCRAVADIYAIRASDCALHFAPFGFDASVEQWCVSLLGGGAIRLSDDELWTPDELEQVIERDRITIVYPPVSHMLQLAQAREAHGRRGPRLRVCCIGGEAMPKRHVELIRAWLGPQLLVNGYGPTETVVTPLLWAATPDLACDTAYAPIGHVVGDRNAYILDRELNVLPIGATGELYIGGTGMARGYQGRPAITAERFVPDPFTGTAGARMYRTGDLVRMLDDGAIEYIARIDHQVKLRGFRIELGEIEAALLDQPGVDEAYALVHEEEGKKQLVAYIGGSAEQTELQALLRARLPEHMVPQRIVALERLPRTRHGKVDRARLPRPEAQLRPHEAPEGEVEHALSQLWCEILGVPQVGRRDNFFELGGDSILSILVVSRARELGYALTPRQLFAHPTLAALAAVAQPHTVAASPKVEEEPTSGTVPLTPMQRLFFETQTRQRDHFNLSVLLRATRPLDPVLLEQALQALCTHHAALRYRYRAGRAGSDTTDGTDAAGDPGSAHAAEFTQYLSPADEQTVLVHERVAPDGIEAACQRAQRSLNLSDGPLLRALLLHVSDGSERLLVAVHHLVSDGVSFRFLLDDLQTAYRQLEQGRAAVLPSTSTTFHAFAERLARHAGEETPAREFEYYQRELRAAPAELPRDAGASGGGAGSDAPVEPRCELALGAAVTRALTSPAPAVFGAQIQDLLLGALARALASWTGQTEHLIELEGHGRDLPWGDIDVTRCVGWFTRLYPLRLSAAPTLGETVQLAKKQREDLPDNGFGYGLLRELAPEPLRSQMRALPQPRITFNYLGQFDASFDPQGLLVPAAESAGDEVSAEAAHANWLQFDAEVYDGQLKCTLLYEPQHFAHATMSRLLQAFGGELAALAEQARQSDAREADELSLKPRQYTSSPLVQLGTGTHAPPLFCMHPLGGVVFDYHSVARRLAGTRSVYGLQCRTLVDPSWVDTSIEDMANAYARLIVEAQPDGPYHLLGWSFGADLAIETAHVLEQNGRSVAFLGLVDRLVSEAAPPGVGDDDDEEGDVLAMACTLLAARYPGFSRKDLLLQAYGQRKRGAPDRDVVRALVGRVTGASADAQQSFDLEGLFVMHAVLQNMYRVSEKFVLKPLNVSPHCWWSSESQTLKAKLVRALEEGLGQSSALDVDVTSTHLEIIYDPEFVESLARLLRASDTAGAGRVGRPD